MRVPLGLRLPLLGRLQSSTSAWLRRPLAAAHEADGMGFLHSLGALTKPANNVAAWHPGALPRGSEASPLALVPPPRHDSPVLGLIRSRFEEQRLAGGSDAPPVRTDGARLGLVVEGGGMRGCVSAGALLALRALGLPRVFDAVYGASAGAINATYSLADQPEGESIYYDHIAHPDFLSLRRLWRAASAGAPPALNLGMLIDTVMETVLPLAWERVLRSWPPLKIVASDLDSLAPVMLDAFESKEDLKACLRASATVPELAGEPVACRGMRLVDAAVFEAVPFRTAIADGCTHVLVLSSRPRPSPRGSARATIDEALEAVVKRALLSPEYMAPAWRAEAEALVHDGLSPDHQLLEALDPAVQDPAARPWFAGAHVYPVYPGPAAGFSPMCTDTRTLRAGIEAGRRAVLATLQPILLGLVA